MNLSAKIARWGLDVDSHGEICIGNVRTTDLAVNYGTPLHVVHADRLSDTAKHFLTAVRKAYPGIANVHFAFKCNPVSGVILLIKQAGLCAEIMSEAELFQALALGFSGSEIVVNGPHKTVRMLTACIQAHVRFIQLDSLDELDKLEKIATQLDTKIDVLLRVNPDFIPSGMNQGSATASRIGSPLGLDLKGGEIEQALVKIQDMQHVRFKGFHLHIGSGIQHVHDFKNALMKLKPMVQKTIQAGFRIEVLNVGGGLGVPDSREMSTLELLAYQAFGQLNPNWRRHGKLTFTNYAETISASIQSIFAGLPLPELLFEPGRCIAGPNQLLLLNVHQVKERNHLKTWVITDGGIGTTTMPTFYEHHAVVLCNEVDRKPLRKVTISGPGCFAADVVYHSIVLPETFSGDTLAILDSGAYFSSWESNFGYPRPAVIAVKGGQSFVLRNRETFGQMISNDTFHKNDAS